MVTVVGIRPLYIRTRNKRAEQELVRDRIEILSEDGALFENASQNAVERIGKSGTDKQSEAERKAIFKDCSHQKGSQADADDREQIWRSAEGVSPGSGIFGHRLVRLAAILKWRLRSSQDRLQPVRAISLTVCLAVAGADLSPLMVQHCRDWATSIRYRRSSSSA